MLEKNVQLLDNQPGDDLHTIATVDAKGNLDLEWEGQEVTFVFQTRAEVNQFCQWLIEQTAGKLPETDDEH